MYRLANFMRGRRGWDQLGFFLVIASLIIELAGRFMRMGIVYYAGLALFFYAMYRALSRNLAAREAENQKYLQMTNRFRNWRYFRQQKRQGTYTYTQNEQQRNGAHGSTIYAYYYCPACKQQVRIPAGKGSVMVTCPRCGEKFKANS